MSSFLLAGSEVDCWQSCLERIKQRLNNVLSKLEEGEADWAPDIGVASPKDHLWAIAESARNLLGILGRGRKSTRSHQAAEIEFSEIERMLRICESKLQAELGTLQGQEIDLEVADAVLQHIDAKSHHTAAIASLTQLIDPSRLSALLH